MHKVVPVLALLGGIGVVLAGGHFATIPTAAAAGAVATSAPVLSDPAPPSLDVVAVPSASRVTSVAPAKRKTTATATTKQRIYHCEIRPLEMGTTDTMVRVCDWRDG